MSSLFVLVNQIVNDPKYRPLLAIVKAMRNGIVYGCKIRFPHALVMTFLFRQGSVIEKLRSILLATYTHATNLAQFGVVYKAILYLLQLLWMGPVSSKSAGGRKQWHTLCAAFIGGYFVFGVRNSVNEQINMYLLSRTLFGLARLAQERGLVPVSKRPLFPWFAACVWAVALWLFENHMHTLQSSLQASMTYLHHDSNKWNSFTNLLVYNK